MLARSDLTRAKQPGGAGAGAAEAGSPDRGSPDRGSRALSAQRSFQASLLPQYAAYLLMVAFLALLELVRERLVDIVQNEPFAPIHAQIAIL